METKEYLELDILVNREFYDFYRENRKKCAKGINQYMLFDKAVKGLLMEFKKMITTTDTGVHIKDIGYFCNVKANRKKRKYKEKNPLLKFKKYYLYDMWWYPEDRYMDWHLDFEAYTTFHKPLKKYYFDLDTTQANYEIDRMQKLLLHTKNKQYKFMNL